MIRSRSSETTIIVLTAAAHALAHIYTLALPAVLLLFKDEFKLNNYQAGALATLLNFTFGLGSLPSGFLVDRIGSKRMLLLFLVGSGAASVGVGFVHSASMLACAMAALGLMCSMYHPAGLAILSRSCQQRGIALGIHGVGGSLGLTIAPLLTGKVAEAFGWRWAYATLGVLGFAAAFVLAVSRIEEGRPGASPAHPRDADETVSASSLVASFVILCCAVVGISICFQGSSAFLNTHIIQQIAHTTPGRALFLGNVYTSVIFGIGILGQVVGGYLADRTHREEVIMTVATSACVPFLILTGLSTGLVAPCLAMPFGFFYFSTQPVYNCLISKYTRPRLRGAAFGLTSFLTFGVGSTGAAIAGWAADHWGGVGCVFPIMAIGAALSALACGALMGMQVSRRRSLPPSQMEVGR